MAWYRGAIVIPDPLDKTEKRINVVRHSWAAQFCTPRLHFELSDLRNANLLN